MRTTSMQFTMRIVAAFIISILTVTLVPLAVAQDTSVVRNAGALERTLHEGNGKNGDYECSDYAHRELHTCGPHLCGFVASEINAQQRR